MIKAKGKTISLIITLCCAFCLKIDAQNNIVPNNSFENTSNCPYVSGVFFPSIWYGSGGSPDYFNICDTSNFQGVPINLFGYQYPHTGNAYVGLNAFANSGFNREFIGVQLSTALNSGQTYYVNFHVSLSDSVSYAIKNMGALFTNTVFNPSSVSIAPQIEADVILNDKTNWIEISGSFVATGNEKYITIGNFRDDANTTVQFLGGGGPSYQEAYYYIDDVYVSETPLGVNELKNEGLKFEAYPNPFTESVLFKTNTEAMYQLKIMDITGKQIEHIDFKGKEFTYQNNQLNNGLYFYEIIDEHKNSVRGKIVKQ
jgi:hypothetical protein